MYQQSKEIPASRADRTQPDFGKSSRIMEFGKDSNCIQTMLLKGKKMHQPQPNEPKSLTMDPMSSRHSLYSHLMVPLKKPSKSPLPLMGIGSASHQAIFY